MSSSEDMKKLSLEILKSLVTPGDVMSPAQRAQYKNDTGEDVLTGAPEEAPKDTKSQTLQHMNETYERSQQLTKEREAEIANRDRAYIDSFKKPAKLEQQLNSIGIQIKEVLSNKNYARELIDIIRDSADTDTQNPKGKGK